MFNLIPKPIKANILPDTITINSATTISADTTLVGAMNIFNTYVEKAIGTQLKTVDIDADIQFIKSSDIVQEGYIIDCKEGKVIVSASAFSGAFYAAQTLRIHFNLDIAKGEEVSAATIYVEDAPRFEWRGLMLDVSRHFQEKSEVKRIIDMMALHKLNTLHWHLTDDQGWRIEIKKYPLLIEIGSKRKDTQVHGWRKSDLEGKPHEGYYTQEDIKEIVAYAQERAVDIVPEIDMPAHFAAAMAGYNHLACREIPCEVFYYFNGTVPESEGRKFENRTACAGKESTFEFVFDVIDEMCELFPSKYFHIGGDEAPKDEWKNCPHCQARMKEENLKNEEELQGYFNNRIYAHLREKGKRLVGWNEILNASNLDKDAVAQYWTMQRSKKVEEFAKKGGTVVLSKFQSFYFDMSYAQVPLKNTYNFRPEKIGIPKSCEKNILGVEGALWAEWIDSRKKLDSNLFPRMEALAEVAWTQEDKKDYDDFLVRLDCFHRILDANDVWYTETEVADPKGRFKRLKDMQTWYASNQHKDVEYNEIAKSKRNKK